MRIARAKMSQRYSFILTFHQSLTPEDRIAGHIANYSRFTKTAMLQAGLSKIRQNISEGNLCAFYLQFFR